MSPDSFQCKVYQEALFVKGLLGSCITKEQLENTKEFFKGLINRWEFTYTKFSKRTRKRIYPFVQGLIDMNNEEYKTLLSSLEKHIPVKNKFVVHGFE